MSANIGEGKYVISVDNQGAINQLNQFSNAADQTGKKTSASFKQGLTAAVSLTAGIASLAFQFDNLDRTQLRVRKTALEMSRAQEEVNKLAKDGKQGTLDYEQALERLAIATEKNRQAQTDATQSQIAFGLSMAQTALTIPSAISAVQGLTSATSVLNIVNSKWILIALAVIAAYEGITQAIKYFTGQDYTITGAVGKMLNSMNGLSSGVDIGAEKMTAYGDSIAYTGAVASNSAQQLQSFGKAVDIANVKIMSSIDNLKKNENKLTLEINETARSLGIDLDSIRNFGAMGMDTSQTRLLRTLSNSISGVFRSLRSTGLLSTSKSLHGNFGNGVGLTQTQTANMINNGRTGSTASRSGSSKARGGGFGGFKPGFGVQEVAKPFNAAISGFQATADYYRSLGFNISVPSFNLQSMVGSYRSPSNEFLQTSIRQATTNYNSQVARFNEQIAQANATIENRILSLASRSGLSRSEVVALENQGRLDEINHMIEYRDRLAAMSSGSA